MQIRPDIGLIGPKRSGKDTVAQHLVEKYGYTRIAFADPLKVMALRVDTLLDWGAGPTEAPKPWRLSNEVTTFGWEHAKDRYPEARRFLADLGLAVRELDRDFWLKHALRKIRYIRQMGKPIVVTDVRFFNEAHTLRYAGFKLYRLHRPGFEPGPDAHVSETELQDLTADGFMVNSGTVEELHMVVDAVMGGMR